jgi:hypothetical protein
MEETTPLVSIKMFVAATLEPIPAAVAAAVVIITEKTKVAMAVPVLLLLGIPT